MRQPYAESAAVCLLAGLDPAPGFGTATEAFAAIDAGVFKTVIGDVAAVIVLAAGQGTRMKSRLPKVLHPLGAAQRERPLCVSVIPAQLLQQPAHPVAALALGPHGFEVTVAEPFEALGAGVVLDTELS